MSKKLEELQNKFKEENQDQLQENSELLENKIKKMEKEAQKIINKDFRSFIYTMNKKNTVIKYLYSDTHTTPIMDEFANDDDKDFLVLRGIFSDKDLVVTKRQNNVEVANVPSPTMTELKKYKNKSCVKGRLAPLIHEICKYDSSKLKNGQKVQFNKPFPLGGQTSANQTGYGWEWDWSNGCGDYIEGTYYGEVTTFFVIGFIFRGNKYFL